MGRFSGDEEGCQFFDADENIPVLSDSDYDSPDCLDPDGGINDLKSSSFKYNLWIGCPGSVNERRRKFFRWMGLDVGRRVEEDVDFCRGVSEQDIARIMEGSGAVLRTSASEDVCSTNKHSVLNCSESDLPGELGTEEDLVCQEGSLDGEATSSQENLGHDSILRFSDLDQLMKSEIFDDTAAASPLVQQLLQAKIPVPGHVHRARSWMRKWWSSRLHSLKCVMERQENGSGLRITNPNSFQGGRVQKVRVRHCRKRSKGLSALFMGQDFQAHDGSILTMKFSSDGRYLASAGEDKVIRVWQVVEDERLNEIDIPDIDPSCIYFAINHLSELAYLATEKDKMRKSKGTADSVCVVFPPKVFRILERPLHEFHGHGGEVLDLSWSPNLCLLSSSVDTTVRLWKVGCEQCLKVFSHSNYVTCVQFNPVNDNYFISGSIDGKVRIWSIGSSQVADWTDVKDIVTAVTYHPDGKAGIVGSMSGNCRFFNLLDNCFILEAQICLNGKKKSSCNRICGFQFLPQDQSKVMVTCGDSQARILCGINVIGKYKCSRNSGNLISAFLTSDGKHIVAASEDSNVYVWDCVSHGDFSSSHPIKIKAFECFLTDASVAIPWSGFKSQRGTSDCQLNPSDEGSVNTLHISSSTCFTLGQEYILESVPKGSATWPEEKLLSSSRQSMPSMICKSHYSFFRKSCQSSSNSFAWGLVIVTAGWDGRIRSFLNYGLPVPQ